MIDISVVIPVKNRESLVSKTLDSLAAQTRQPGQIILVDNGSTDSTLETLERFAAGRENVTVVSELRPGAAEARNCGLREVKCEYVLFFDSDDLMPERHIEEICRELERAGRPDIGAFGIEIVNLDHSVSKEPFRPGDLMFNHIFHTIFSTVRYAVRTDFLRMAGGWPEETPVWDDYLLGIRLLCRRARITELKLSQPVSVIVQRESISGTEFSSRSGQWEIMLDRCESELRATGYGHYAKYIDYRRALLGGEYRREGHPELARRLNNSLKFRLLERYVAAGGRGLSLIARLLR